jgi:hypothetical protein
MPKKVRCENYKNCNKKKCKHYWNHTLTSACEIVLCYLNKEWKKFKCL